MDDMLGLNNERSEAIKFNNRDIKPMTPGGEENSRKVREMTADEEEAEATFYYQLGVRMQQGRVGVRKTQSEMGYDLFMTDNTVSAIERGVSKPRAYILKLFCEATGIEPNDLLEYKKREETATELRIMAMLKEMSPEDKDKLLSVLEILYPEKKPSK